jgi:hypothetical protein
MSVGENDPEHQAARRLYELSLDYAEKALATQADLLRAFEADAGPDMRLVGEVVIDHDNDEHLVLRADGTFGGTTLDDDTGVWNAVRSAEDVADHYDPVDVFTDLADAIAETFPGLEDEEALAGSGWADAADSNGGTTANPESPESSSDAGDGASLGADMGTDRRAAPHGEQIRALEDLRKAGVMTQAQFEAAKAKLDRT